MSDWLDAESHADRALEMYERGRWAEAEFELRKALSLNPDQAEWHYNLGLTLEAAGRDLEALGSYERAVYLMPEEIEPLVAAGVACNRLQRYEQAIGWFEQALTLSATCEAAYAHKIAALVHLGEHEEAEAVFYLAQHALEDPSAHCLAAISESLIERGAFDRASWCLKEAQRLDPGIPRLRARLGAVFAATGKPQRALQMYLRDLRDDPGNIDTLLDYGELLIDLGRLPEAAEKFRRVLELEPANVDAHHRLGQIAMTSEKFEQAHLEFELVLKLDLQFPLIRLGLAESLLRRGYLTEARAHLRDELDAWGHEDVVSRPADDVERFGSLLLQADMVSQAAEMLQKAATMQSEDRLPGLLRNLAVARFRWGDTDGGMATSRRVLRLDPDCVASIHNLALANLQTGHHRLAAGWIARGLRLNRHDDGLRRLRMQLWLATLRRTVARFFGRRG